MGQRSLYTSRFFWTHETTPSVISRPEDGNDRLQQVELLMVDIENGSLLYGVAGPSIKSACKYYVFGVEPMNDVAWTLYATEYPVSHVRALDCCEFARVRLES